MGANSSIARVQKPLTPQRQFEATIHRRYVKEFVVTLEFEDQFWSKPHTDVIEIKDVDNNKVMFRVPPPPAPAAGEEPQTPVRKLLLDTYGVPVAGLEAYPLQPAAANATEYAVIPGGKMATNEIYRFATRFNMYDFPLELLINPDTPETRVQIIVTRKWLARQAYVSIKRGETGAMQVIARVYTADLRDGKYRMDIAPGVDVSLMVLLAAAMDEQSPKYMTSVDRQTIRHEIKKVEKSEKAQRAPAAPPAAS